MLRPFIIFISGIISGIFIFYFSFNTETVSTINANDTNLKEVNNRLDEITRKIDFLLILANKKQADNTTTQILSDPLEKQDTEDIYYSKKTENINKIKEMIDNDIASGIFDIKTFRSEEKYSTISDKEYQRIIQDFDKRRQCRTALSRKYRFKIASNRY